MTRDYIPCRDTAFDTWFFNLMNYVMQKADGAPHALDHIQQHFLTDLAAAYQVRRNAFAGTLHRIYFFI